MGRPLRAFRHVTAREPLFDVGLGVHREPVLPSHLFLSPGKKKIPLVFAIAAAFSLGSMISRRVWQKSGAITKDPGKGLNLPEV
jgi:hypothetical protein